MRKTPGRWWLPAALGATLVLLIVTSAFTARYALQTREETALVLHALEVQKALQKTSNSMRAAETAQRAYVITGSQEFLHDFGAHVADAGKRLDQVRRLTGEEDVQRDNLARVRRGWNAKVAEMRAVIGIRRDAGIAPAARRVASGLGVRLMDDVLARLARLEADEDRQLGLRRLNTAQSEFGAALAFLIGTVTSAFLLTLVGLLSLRLRRQDEVSVQAEIGHAASLETEVRARDVAEESERRVLEELRRSNRELQDFAFVASHDLQEPLRKIQAFGDRLRRKEADRLTPEGRDYLDRMLSASSRMQRLIEDLLVFSRVTSKARPMSATDLNRTLADVREDLHARIEASGGDLRVGPLPTIEGDPTQLHQLFQNLVGNALKFARPGSPPTVEVSAAPAGDGKWTLRVRDDGIGFDPKHAERIFTIFQRLHGRSEYEGSGVGLAIVRKIVERHGGTIRVEAAPGEGATFEITLSEKGVERREDEESAG